MTNAFRYDVELNSVLQLSARRISSGSGQIMGPSGIRMSISGIQGLGPGGGLKAKPPD